MSIVIVHGPQGSGKTRFAELLAKHYGSTRIVDCGKSQDDAMTPFQDGDLVLTNDPPAIAKPGMLIVDIETALRDAGITAAKTAGPQTITLPTLAAGETYAGLILKADGTPSHHLILLPSDHEANWAASKAWAATIGGELPSRAEQSLLFANCKQQFRPNWYWSGEQHAAHSVFAWTQDFINGNQYGDDASYEGRARAVRRLVI